jgi:hypothetical protein
MRQELTLGAIATAIILLLAGVLPRRARYIITALLAGAAAGAFIIENRLYERPRRF